MTLDIRACQPDELDGLVSLLDEEFIFGKKRTISLKKRFPTVFCRNNLDNLLLCTQEKRIISALAIKHFIWRESDKNLHGVMLGSVYTHPDWRGKGWASRLLEEAVKRLRNDGVDFGVLWTEQHDFYKRLGWTLADCSVLGEVVSGEQTSFNVGGVTRFSVENEAHRLDLIRSNSLGATLLRGAGEYCNLPIPSEHLEVLLMENQQGAAYALLGRCGTVAFLYEMIGDVACFPSLWSEACRGHQKVYINDHRESFSSCWFADNVDVRWKDKNLAMWMPLSEKVSVSLIGNWHIPYFDRI